MTSLDIPHLVQSAIRWLTALGAPVTLFCLLILLRVAFLAGPSGRVRLDLATRGLSDSGSSRFDRVRHLVLPLVAVTVLTVSFAIEQEVREGPTRSIETLQIGGAETAWVTQPGTRHLMNQSRIPAETANIVVDTLNATAIPVAALQTDFATIDTEDRSLSAYVFALDEQTRLNPVPQPGHRCDSGDGEPCRIGSDHGIIVDAGNGLDIGETIQIRGKSFEVVAYATEPRSLLNRLVVYVTPQGMTRIQPDPTYFALIAATSQSTVEQILVPTGVDTVEVRSQDQLRGDNEDFWAGNGTPLLLLLIAMIAAFAAAATYLSQRAEQEQNRVVLGTLWAVGLPRPQMIEVQLLRSLLAIAATVPLAWLVASTLIYLTNRSIIGFSADTQLDHLLAATALVCLGALGAAASLASRNRKATPFQAQS